MLQYDFVSLNNLLKAYLHGKCIPLADCNPDNQCPPGPPGPKGPKVDMHLRLERFEQI